MLQVAGGAASRRASQRALLCKGHNTVPNVLLTGYLVYYYKYVMCVHVYLYIGAGDACWRCDRPTAHIRQVSDGGDCVCFWTKAGMTLSLIYY